VSIECGKLKSTGETGFSTEGNEERLLVDEAPEQQTQFPYCKTQYISVNTRCLTSLTDSQSRGKV